MTHETSTSSASSASLAAARRLRRLRWYLGWALALALGVMLVVLGAIPARADTLELLSGIKLQGEVLDKNAEFITIRVTIAGRTITRKYKAGEVHAVTIGGERELLNERPKSGTGTPGPKTKAADPKSGAAKPGDPKPSDRTSTGNSRSRDEVEALIRAAGQTKPAWFDDTPLNFPRTLDLSFPQPAPKGWNNQANVGQYLWDIINPNPSRWHEGVKFLHHLLDVNKGKLDVEVRVMRTLGDKYHDLLEDYSRAAYWWRAASAKQAGAGDGVELAECYYRLGNRQMAVDLLRKLPVTVQTIKLWADMGDLDQARKIADAARNSDPRTLAAAYLYVADGYRSAGQFKRALDYYNQVLAVGAGNKDDNRLKRDRDRAQSSIEAIRLFELTDVKKVPDGAYQSSSLGYEGQVHVEVVVADGKIMSVRVTQHREKQFYSALTDTPRKIIDKQGVKGVDATSSATITSEAIINATAKALASGAK